VFGYKRGARAARLGARHTRMAWWPNARLSDVALRTSRLPRAW